ncbi:MAG: PAS domain S-box protein [Bacteroidetes bacterium]|jgi:PAS domain S-box-containing protein|nr:PAS domain S-box protein [Bacteroidota bacterium]
MAAPTPASTTSWLHDLALAIRPAEAPVATCTPFVHALLDHPAIDYASVWLYEGTTNGSGTAVSARLIYAAPDDCVREPTVQRAASLLPLLDERTPVTATDGDDRLELLLAQESLSGGGAMILPLGATGFLKLHTADASALPDAQTTAALEKVVDRFRETLDHTLHVRSLTQRARQQEDLQAQLRTTSVRLSSVITNMQAAVLVEDKQRRIVRVNQAFCDLFRLDVTPDDLVGASSEQMADLVCDHFTEPMAFAARIESILQDGTAVLGEPLRMQDGRVLERDYVPIQPDDTPVGYLWQYRDVSARVRAQHALAESEARYRQLVEQARDLIYRVDPDGYVTYANPVAFRRFALTEDVLGDLHFTALVRGDYQEKVAAFYQQQIAQKTPSTYYEFPVVTHDGREIWVGQNAQLLWEGETFRGLQAVARDITQRRAAEDALRESERRYRSVIENTREVIFQTDPEGRWTFLNPAWTEILQYPVAESLETSFLEYIHPADRPAYAASFQKLMAQEVEAERHEIRYLTREGDVRWMEVHARLMLDDGGQPTGTTGSLSDITSRRRATEALHRRVRLENLITELTARFIDAPNEAIDALIEDTLASIGAFVDADRSYVFLLQEDEEHVDNTHEWCADGVAPQIDNLQNLPTASLPWWMHRLRNLDNIYLSSLDDLPPEATSLRELLVSQDIRSLIVVPMIESGALIGFVGFDAVREERSWSEDTVLLLRVVADVVASALQRKQAQEDLQQSEERWRRLVENHPEPLLIGAPDAIVYANPSAAQLFGVDSPDALVGRSPCDFIAAEYCDEIMSRTEAVAEGARVAATAHTVTRPDGEERFVESFAVPVVYEGRPAAQTVMRDLTDRHRHEQELRRAKALAEASSQAKEQFLANMSHEMRTPLSAIIGMTYLLGDTPLTDDQQRHLDGIHFSADTLLSLINDLLDFAKIESGHIEFESVAFELPELIHNMADTMRFKAEQKELALRVALDETLPPVLVGDPTRLSQILLNLLGNALKFTHDGQVSLIVRPADHPGDEAPVRIAFVVEDTGIGIPQDKLEDIFDTFTQARRDTTRHFGGTGLGLSIVKELTTRMGGTLDVQSAEGEGSTFTITLPFETAAPDAVQETRPLPEADIDLSGVRILLVEDNEINQTVAQRILARWDVEVTLADDGETALARLREQSFDLVLMDIHMPGLDGYETTRRIREDLGLAPEALPVLALTASVRVHQGKDTERAGMNDFVLKPFVPRELRRCIARHLTSRPSDDTTPNSARPMPDEPTTAPIDLTYLRQQTDHDATFLRTMIDLTMAQLREGRATLTEAHETNDWATARFTAHKLKSTANTVGAAPLARVLADVEDRILEDEYRRADALLETVPTQIQNVMDALQAALPEEPMAMDA